MADYKIQDTTLKAIADSIRSKTGSTEGLYPTEMASAIDGITVGADYDIIEDLEIDLDLSEGNQTLYAPNGSLVKSAIINKPETLLSENIAKDIEIAGIVGTLEAEQHTLLEDMELELNLAEGNQELTVPDGYAVKSAIIKKPDTLIPENIAEGINIAGVIGTFKGSGSGNVEGFATVTFMNGNEVIYTRPVYIGDDCPDPVTQGRIETPTKESTAQYDYTHNGWASVDGGTANSNVLKNIQADTVVYSAYKESVRYYTITYFDEDGTTVLHTEQLAYGDIPSYAPTKEGAAFDKWTPTIAAVTGNASYTASWKTGLVAYGDCGENGDNATWELSVTGVLTISGIGNMMDNANKQWSSYEDNITSVVIEDGITNIGSFAFYECGSIASVTISDSVTSIGDSAFRALSLTDIDLPNNITSIGNFAFLGCQFTSIVLPNSLTNIGTKAFMFANLLESVNIPKSVTTIGESVFYGTSLNVATFEDTEGWVAGDISLASSDLANPTTAATYLKTTYYKKVWTNT